MRSILRRTLLPLVATLGLAACGADAPVEPRDEPAVPLLKIVIDRIAADSSSADFTVTPGGGTFALGPHAIEFPPSSICDPVSSGYGLAQWDAPCTPLARPIQIHAEVRQSNGLAVVDFSPELRFVPTRDSNRWVYIWLRVPDDMSVKSAKRTFNILWSPAPGLPGIDESLTDKSLRTRVDHNDGLAYRRIKHFSGYIVAVGFKQDLGADDGVIPGLF